MKARLDRDEWVRARSALQQYREKPSTANLFKVFAECVGRTDIWLVSQGRAPDRFQRFEQAARACDETTAWQNATDALRAAVEVDAATAVGLVLAARALLVHRLEPVADEIARWLVDEAGAVPEDVLLDWLLLRLRCRVGGAETERLFGDICERRHAQVGTAAAEWLHHRWRYQGPDAALLQESLALKDRFAPTHGPYLKACLALALRVDASDAVDDLLQAQPKLTGAFDAVLPLAAYLEQRGGTDTAVAAYAALSRSIQTERDAVAQRLRSADSLAIVGNSPCEQGLGKGMRIDAHKEVVRFNYFELRPEFAPDYGQRFTLHARGPGASEELNARSAQLGRAVICTYDFTQLPRNWKRFLTLHEQGIRFACLPVGFHQPLQHELQAEPSLGLAFCAYAKSIRGILPRESCFGFAFVDQLVSAQQKARYFGGPPPALTHRWKEELTVFNRLVT